MNEKQKKGIQMFNRNWIIFAVLAAIFAAQMIGFSSHPIEIGQQEFFSEMLAKGDVESIEVVKNKGLINVTIKPDKINDYSRLVSGGFTSKSPGPHFTFTFGSLEIFEQSMKEAKEANPQIANINEEFVEENDVWLDILSFALPIGLLILFWMFMMRRVGGGSGGGGVFNVGKSQARLFDSNTTRKVTFNDVAGMTEAKQEVLEVVDFLKNPLKYTRLGGKIPKGVLLVGPPGTGKTLMARAMAGEANVPFFLLSGSDFVEMFVGVGASRVRDLFKQAKEKAPCIIFIDEIDAIGRARGKNAHFNSNDERENTLNQLLTEMDGFETNSGVIVVAATNRADILDSALLRAGRFDRLINVDLPELKDREAIFKVHMKGVKYDQDVDHSFLAKQTPGFSGADIANAVNEAALIAARRNHNTVTKQDFMDAIDRIVGGLENKSKVIRISEKKSIAYHEAGHAVCSWMLQHANPLLKVTIVPRGRALGAAWYLPKERQLSSKEQLMDQMCSLMGGRAAEELIFHEVTTGAQNDLERATKMAYSMVSIFGMSSEVGNLSFNDSGGDMMFVKPYSEKTAEAIDKASRELVEASYQKARQILTDNKEGHRELAELLLEREVIFREDVEKILGPRPWKDEEEPKEETQEETRKETRTPSGEASGESDGEQAPENAGREETAGRQDDKMENKIENKIKTDKEQEDKEEKGEEIKEDSDSNEIRK